MEAGISFNDVPKYSKTRSKQLKIGYTAALRVRDPGVGVRPRGVNTSDTIGGLAEKDVDGEIEAELEAEDSAAASAAAAVAGGAAPRHLRSSARLSGGAQAPAQAPRQDAAKVTAARTAAGRLAAAQRRARAAERAREVEDSPRVLRDKCRRLARALRNAKHLVVYTGAGISTAADIPDYRGPHGVWTRLQRGETVGRVEVSRAQPTFTHMALTALWSRGTLKFVVSQNCDGLHVRSGLPRRALAELHGDMFAERCAPCRRVYLRAFDTTERTARHHHSTRRLCHACGTELHDTIVHFGERGRSAWPLNWAGALRHASRADVVLCLGSSLKVLRRYPRLWRMQSAPNARPRLYIVNLQWTPKDSVAALKINARCDVVMRQVARRLRLRVPKYRASGDPLLAHAEPLAPPEAHTTRRPPLPPPDYYSDGSSASELGSPSASDSDEELPLRCLADRLRGASPPATGPELVALQVELQAGAATILLRAEHARAAPSLTAELRRVRLPARPPAPPSPLNGHAPNGLLEQDPPLRRLVLESRSRSPDSSDSDDSLDLPSPRRRNYSFEPLEPKPEPKPEFKVEPPPNLELKPDLELKPAGEPKVEVKREPKTELSGEADDASSGSEGAGSLAAAIIARAVLLCRGSLYPGLHTIIAGGGGGECAWCLRRLGSARCQWYGPPRLTPAPARAWRRVRARRYLCACCPSGGGEAPRDEDGGGWYGKGYRKGRRRRR